MSVRKFRIFSSNSSSLVKAQTRMLKDLDMLIMLSAAVICILLVLWYLGVFTSSKSKEPESL